MRKNDFLLIGFIGIAALCGFLLNVFFFQKEGKTVVVTVDGREYGRYPLDEDTEVDIGGTNRLVISGQKADMTEADCPDKLCVRQQAIDKTGQTIVCLPNRVIVTVEGGKGPEGPDAVVN